MMRSVIAVLAVAAFVYLGACAALFFFQRSLIYFPQPGSLDSSSQIRLPVDGAELRVSVRPLSGPNALIYFGGNAEDVSASLPWLTNAFADHAIFLMHYRGYGGSSGAPSEPALQADALKLFDKIHAEHPNVVVVGRSLGSGIAVRVAAAAAGVSAGAGHALRQPAGSRSGAVPDLPGALAARRQVRIGPLCTAGHRTDELDRS